MDDDDAADYDEFADLQKQAKAARIPWRGQPHVKRRSVLLGSGHRLSALAWGVGGPEVLLIHGSGQNAHTWDMVALALDRPLIAIDLPGHGHSDWREDADYQPSTLAGSIADAMVQLALRPAAVVGTSLGGLTTIRLAATCPELVRRAVVVDVTPSSSVRLAALNAQQRGANSLLTGPLVYESFDAMLEAAATAVPGRPVESLRPGVLHNARRLPDGRWAWRYDRIKAPAAQSNGRKNLWDDLASTRRPIMLVRGSDSPYVHDHDLDEFKRRRPDARFEQVDGAGHSVQSDKPARLAKLISDFIATS
jgi:pimeloyl-ACP methyl ester carboxylesterase